MENIKNCFKSGICKLKEDKLRLILFLVYTVYTVFCSIYFFTNGYIRNGFLPIAYYALFVVVLNLFEYFLSMECSNLFLTIIFSIPVGGILGSCFDLYLTIPFLDTLLHTISGFIFAALGYSLMNRLLGRSDGKYFGANLMFGTAFSLGLATLWELFEWLLTSLMKGDMLEDTVVYNIYSYLLSGNHNTPENITDIDKTLIYYDGGKIYELEGYLDLGGLDSLTDMAVCLAGAIAFIILALIGKKLGERFLNLFVPALKKKHIIE